MPHDDWRQFRRLKGWKSSDIIENLLEKKLNSKREAKDEVCFRLGEREKKLDADRKITVEILRGFNVALAQTFAFA